MPTFDFQKIPPREPLTAEGAGPWLLAAREELNAKQTRTLHALDAGPVRMEVRQGRQSLWLAAQGLDQGGFAFRLAWAPDGLGAVRRRDESDATSFHIGCSLGALVVRVRVLGDVTPVLRWTLELTPEEDTLVPFWPRDVYPLDEDGDPMQTAGIIHAAQRDTCGGLLFLSLTKPRGGSLFYFQNLTALNDYCLATRTVPDTVVGGQWPELGFTLPVTDAGLPLPKGTTVTLSDALVRFSPVMPENDRQAARLFFDLLSDIYPWLDRPDTAFHDWPRRARQTIRDLQSAKACHAERDGHICSFAPIWARKTRTASPRSTW